MAILNKSLKVRTDKGYHAGDKTYGAPGGFRDSWSFVCSYAVADRLAAEAGLDAEHAHRFLIALGKTAQRMLLDGDPVGIPYLGVLFIHERHRRVAMAGLVARAKARGFQMRVSEIEGRVVKIRTPSLFMPDNMRTLFNDNALYTGPLPDHVRRKRDQLKRRLRRHKNGGLRHTQEGPIMESNTTAPKTPAKKPGMLVEDHNAVVDTAPDGAQAVRKTADRAAEAERRGVSESEL